MTSHFLPPYPPLFSPLDLVRGPLLVVAPHPDDEVIGPGGLVMAHRDRGVAVHTVILTDGGRGDFGGVGGVEYQELRRCESRAASTELGGTCLEFLNFPDGTLWSSNLTSDGDLVQRLKARIESFGPSTVVFPSPFEIHPDHRAASLAVLCAVGAGYSGRLLAYEVGSPVAANLLINITEWFPRKIKALKCFPTQLKHHDLVSKMEALNRSRAVNCDDPTVLTCEAYLRLECSQVPEILSRSDALLQSVAALTPGIPYP